MVNTEWKEYPILDVFDVTNGLSKGKKDFGFGYPFLTFKEVFYNDFAPLELISLANVTEKELIKCSVKKGDIFITRTSETFDELGKSCVALKDYPNTTFNGFCKRLRPNGQVKFSPEYLGFYFKSKNFRDQILSLTTMSTRASLNNEMLGKLVIQAPTFETQKSLGGLLKRFNDKIELNNQMNQTLEEMAQAIFKEWFVEFNFPNEDGAPYKNNGGEMEESELGMIPKRWRVEELGDLLSIQNGYAFKSKDLLDEGTSKVIKIKNISKNNIAISLDGCQFISKETKVKTNEKFKIYSNDVLIAMTGAEVGKIGIIPETEEELYLNQRVGKFAEKIKGGKFYGYNFLSQRETQELLFAKAQGSAQPNISSKGLEEMLIASPEKDILELYSKKVNAIYEKIVKNLGENMILIETRNTLLPKLMSGEVRV